MIENRNNIMKSMELNQRDNMLHVFEEKVRNCNGIVCYGAGRRLETFAKYFAGSWMLDKVLYCVDKNEALQDTEIKLNNRMIRVYPVSKLKKENKQGIALLITNARYDKVLQELTQIDEYKGIEYFCFSHILGELAEKQAMQKELPQNYKITEEAVIPKIIHYCWFGRKPMPDKYKIWMESWEKFCPDYEIKEWNEDSYDVTKNEFMYQAYQQKKWGFVSDYARLDIVYRYGGIYLDTDVELVQGLDDLLYQKGFAGFEANGLVGLGLGFGAIKGLPVIRRMRDDYDGKKFSTENGKINSITCPIVQTEYLEKRGLQQNGEYQIVDDLTIYPEKMFAAKNLYSRRTQLKNYTKSIHHYEATWFDEEERAFYERFEMEMNGLIPSSAHGKL